MNAFGLPEFKPVSQDELRRMWAKYPDGEIRHLILEIERYRRFVAEVDHFYRSIHQSWRNEVGGDLVALHRFKQLMYYERTRV